MLVLEGVELEDGWDVGLVALCPFVVMEVYGLCKELVMSNRSLSKE